MLINQIPTEKVENVQTEEELITVERQYWEDMWTSLQKLQKNKDFKRVILEGYFKDKAINGVSLLATDYVKSKGLRGEVMEQLVAVSALQDYFMTIQNLGTVPDIEDEDEEVEG